MKNGEQLYLQSLNLILENGQVRNDRTGAGTLSVFGHHMRIDISKNIPLLTTKRVPWKSVIAELLWFVKGQTDASILEQQGVRIWKDNSTRAFLDNRGLTELPEGDIGAGYGFQWRHFGANYKTCKEDYAGEGVDQLAKVIDQLKNDPFSRRICMTAWNPSAIDQMALPPCHMFVQFYVDDAKRLSCHLYQRSADMFLGFPWNLFSYSVLTYLLAKRCDLEPHELLITIGDMHLYQNHLGQVEEQLKRNPYPLPTLKLSEATKTKPLEELQVDDFEVIHYNHWPTISAPMNV